MGYLLNILSAFSFFQKRDDDDLVDRMHYFLTTNMLMMLSILVSFKQFGGKPMECLVPDTFPSGWEQYAENYCWAQDTYFLPFKEEVPKEISQREDHKISYYQWVPFFLLIQAVFFSLPAGIWRILNGASGIRVHSLIKQARDNNNVKPEIREQTLKQLTSHLENALRFQRRRVRRHVQPHKLIRCLNLPYKSSYLTMVYLFVKLCFLANVILQFFFLNRFMETSTNYAFYGFDAFRDILNGSQWQHTGVFPRVTLCDLEIRVMANVQRYTIQCVLVINLFNEKIFVFLWFWFVLLTILTTCSFLYWFFILVLPGPPRWFIERHMELSQMPYDTVHHGKDLTKFVYTYLRYDGVFVLRMITMHTGVIMGTDLICSLWCSFYGKEADFQRTISLQTLDLLRKKMELDAAEASKRLFGDNEGKTTGKLSDEASINNNLRRRNNNKEKAHNNGDIEDKELEDILVCTSYKKHAGAGAGDERETLVDSGTESQLAGGQESDDVTKPHQTQSKSIEA